MNSHLVGLRACKFVCLSVTFGLVLCASRVFAENPTLRVLNDVKVPLTIDLIPEEKGMGIDQLHFNKFKLGKADWDQALIITHTGRCKIKVSGLLVYNATSGFHDIRAYVEKHPEAKLVLGTSLRVQPDGSVERTKVIVITEPKGEDNLMIELEHD